MAEGEEGTGTSGGVASRSVFLSYASQDTEIANTVCRELENRGIRCWIAPRDVAPGALYADAIVRAINEANVLLIVLSQSAVASSHVGREVERAASKHKQIIALRIDTAPLSPELEYFLSNSQWIDALALGMPAALSRLADAVAHGSKTPSHPSPVGDHVDKVPQGTFSKRVVGSLAALIVLVIGIGLGIHFWGSPHGIVRPTTVEASPGNGEPAVAPISEKSIAVLPFTDISEKKDQEYFADGIAEEVLDRLAKVPGLKVVGRTSSFRFKGKSGDRANIGAALGVAYLLEGSVRKDAGLVRVTAQLVEAKTGSQRWSDHFESETINILHVQDTIAAQISRALQIAVEVGTTVSSSIKSPEALDAYLLGRQSLDRDTQENSEAAVAHFQRALTLDPTFAPAAMGLAKAYIFIGRAAWLPTRIAFERARDASLLAQRLDPNSRYPHVLLASIHIGYDWDWAGADRELQTAFALGPREIYGVKSASSLAAARGEWDEARQLGIEAIALDPLDADAHGSLGIEVYLRSGHLAEAEQSFRRALQIAPESNGIRYFLGLVLMLQGHFEAALTEFRKETQEDGQLEGSAMVHFAAGHRAEADALLAEAIHHNGTTWPSEIARVYAFRGEKGRAFEWLDRAYDGRDEDLYFIKSDPLFKNIEGDPRFKAFLKKMNLPE
jgi:adenylate cyclase